MENREYPSTFYRGLSSKDFIFNGQVLPSAFQFDDIVREDGYKELSINWNDEVAALEIMLNQRKDNGKIQFGAGAAKLDLNAVIIVLAAFMEKKEFQYERREVEGNPYHGNLLIRGEMDKKIRSMVSNGLALVAGTNIQPQTNQE